MDFILEEVKLPLQELLSRFSTASVSSSDSSSDDGGDEVENWERVFNVYDKFWRRIASMAALNACKGDALVEMEHDFFTTVIDDLEVHRWRVRRPIERILLQGVRDIRQAAFDSDPNSRKQIQKLLECIREEEAKLVAAGDQSLFDTPAAGNETGEVREALSKYDRVCQVMASLVTGWQLEPGQRDKMRRSLTEKIGPVLDRNNIGLVAVAQDLWAHADTGRPLGDALQRAMAGAEVGPGQKGDKPDGEDKALPVKHKGQFVADSGRVTVLQEEEAGAETTLASWRTSNCVTRALTKRLCEYVRMGTDDLARRRAVYNTAVLETLCSNVEDWCTSSVSCARVRNSK